MTRPTLIRATALGLAAAVTFTLACTPGESAVNALKSDKKDEVKLDPNREKREIPSAELPEPTEEEITAWDRKDPEGEKHYYKFDKANSKQMQTYWLELRCLRDKMKEEGEKSLDAEPGSAEQQQWEQFKRAFIDGVANAWQKKLFAEEGQDVLSKSKYIGNIIEAHELVMNGYPVAYNDGDDMEIKRQDALWTVVENKVKDYSDRIGAPMKFPDLENPKEKK